MTPAARLSAAIELIETIDTQRVPAAKALKEWGTAHRFAGSGDRAAIAGLVWDVLRRRASSAWLMDADTPRARALGMLRLERGMDTETISNLCHGERFAPEPLSGAERTALTSRSLSDAPPHIAGDYPEWLDAHLAEMFGDDRMRTYFDLVAGADGWQQYFDEQNIDVVLVRWIDGLSRVMLNDPNWRVAYRTNNDGLFIRAT